MTLSLFAVGSCPLRMTSQDIRISYGSVLAVAWSATEVLSVGGQDDLVYIIDPRAHRPSAVAQTDIRAFFRPISALVA